MDIELFKEVEKTIGEIPRISLATALAKPRIVYDSSGLDYFDPDDAKTLTEKAMDNFLAKHGVESVYRNREKEIIGKEATYNVSFDGGKHPDPKFFGHEFPTDKSVFDMKLAICKFFKDNS